MSMQREYAETIALKAMSWLAGNEELLPVFLGSTGATLEEMRGRASDGEFLGAVLDFLTMDDVWLRDFCDSERLDYALPLQARQNLPGGDIPNWT